jgi:hypothetical protein
MTAYIIYDLTQPLCVQSYRFATVAKSDLTRRSARPASNRANQADRDLGFATVHADQPCDMHSVNYPHLLFFF